MALILSLLALAAGPMLAARFGHGVWRQGLDAFVMVSVLGVILFTLLPDALAHGGFWALLAGLAGFGLPWLGERFMRSGAPKIHRFLLWLGATSLMLHAMSDGIVLRLAENSVGGGWVIAGLLAHRLGASLALWHMMRGLLHFPGRLSVLMLLAIGTMLGVFFVDAAVSLSGPVFGVWQALAAGSLLHVVMHPLGHAIPAEQKGPARGMVAQRLGTAFGLGFILLLFVSHSDSGASAAAHMGTDFVQHLHRGPAMLIEAGEGLAPMLLAVIALSPLFGFALRRIRGKKKPTSWTADLGGGVIASMLLWLFAGLSFDFSAGAMERTTLFLLWVVLTLFIIIRLGARAFLAGLFGPVVRHRH